MISDEIDTKIVYENSQFLRILEAISNSNIYKTYTPELSNQHKISHIQKVLLFSQIIAQNEKLNQNEIKILLASAAFHDCGRKKDRDNGEHGLVSAKIAGEYFRKNIKNLYGIKPEEIGIIQATIEYHVVKEEVLGQVNETKLKEICSKYNVKEEEFENVKQISEILKDADALDRTRFVSGSNLDFHFLRTKTARKQTMIDFARKINEEYANQVINANYHTTQNTSRNKIDLLHDIRHKYKKENEGVYNKEIDLPINIVKEIFSGTLLCRECIKRDSYSSECADDFER